MMTTTTTTQNTAIKKPMSIATQSIVARKLRITITASFSLANGHSVTLADLTSIDAAAQGGAAQGSRIFHHAIIFECVRNLDFENASEANFPVRSR